MFRYRMIAAMVAVPLAVFAVVGVVAQAKPQSDPPPAETLYVRTADGQFVPKVAGVINVNAGTIVVNVGTRAGFKQGDKVVFAHRTKAGLLLKGFGTVTRAYATDSECDLAKGMEAGSIKPNDEVYNVSRDDTRYSLAKAELKPAGE